ncbi:MAG: gamma-glutamyl-gamma-aminobutyrate hydrolase family protein, partial [Actinomycetota bacterium]|nr:gamma-glutamyl-gamma-aminobutyrate hydrolase family protein [Actinomycetota bacterium]
MSVAVGICAAVEQVRWGAWDHTVAMVPRSYATAVQRAGALAVVLPPDDDAAEAPDALLDRIDALILAGGADVDPHSYGARPHEETGDTWPERDRFELAMTHRALERDIPLLGICRGMQMLNVACGGTLVQHLPDSLGQSDHRHTPGTFGDHEVSLEPGSLAAQAAGADRLAVKSH